MSTYEPRFNGPDYIPDVDHARLLKQHERIRDLMLDGAWRTLAEIAAATDDPEASISAQLRHLRKLRFGSFIIDKRRRGNPKSGQYEYRIAGQREYPVGRAEHTFSRNDTHCTPPDVFELVLEALGLKRFGLDPFGNPFSVVPSDNVIMLREAIVKDAHGHPQTVDYEELVDWRQKGRLVPPWSDEPLRPFDADITWGDAYDFDWSGLGAVFCNGPTSACAPWAEYAHGDKGGDENVGLWPVRTGANWWQDFVAPSDAISCKRGRITFLGSIDQAPWHNALSYIGPRADQFVEVMRRWGWCIRNVRDWS